MPFVLPPSAPSLSTQDAITSWPGGVHPIGIYKGGKRKYRMTRRSVRKSTRRSHRKSTTRRRR